MRKRILPLLVITLLSYAPTAWAQHDHGHHHGHPHSTEKHSQNTLNSNDQLLSAVVSLLPSAQEIEKKGNWRKVTDKTKKTVGYAVCSTDESNDIKGYAGPTPVVIVFSADKKIVGVVPLANSETPRFLQRVAESKLLEQWNGLSAKQAKTKKVDTVSGATFSSRSIIETVQRTLEKL